MCILSSYVCVSMCVHLCMCVHGRVCIYACVCTSVHVCLCVCVCMWMHVCMCVHVCTYVCVYVVTFPDAVHPLFTTGLITSFKSHHTVLEFQNELNRTTKFIICDANNAGQWKLLLYFHLCSRKCKATYLCMHQLAT